MARSDGTAALRSDGYPVVQLSSETNARSTDALRCGPGRAAPSRSGKADKDSGQLSRLVALRQRANLPHHHETAAVQPVPSDVGATVPCIAGGAP
jgi:hypothetical protein